MSRWLQEEYIKAYRFAAEAHHGQKFTGTDLPYIMHPTLVCMEVISAFHFERGWNESLIVQCALLHDVLEDSDRTFDQIRSGFGLAVAQGVQALSKNPNVTKENRLKDSLDRIRLQPKEIWIVKLADRITNLQPPPKSWSKEKIARYADEANLIYETLKDSSEFLANRLCQKIESYKQYSD